MTIQMVFLARLRERLGVARETLQLPDGAATVAELLALLRTRGGAFEAELAPGRAFRVAVNQDVVGVDHPLRDGDELAIFPPVTGG
jgi:molybdopterin synthase sulfur carrier subunit